jgi:hypothetical protein
METTRILVSQRQLDELTVRIGRLEEAIMLKNAALLVAAGLLEEAIDCLGVEAVTAVAATREAAIREVAA